MTLSDQVIPFVKATACGNDFLIVDGAYVPADSGELSKWLCDRHNGIGADGVEWLFPAPDADIWARLFNADGTEAEISGQWYPVCGGLPLRRATPDEFSIRTGAGIKSCKLISVNQSQYEFETAMGEPKVGEEFSVKLAGGEARGIPVSMGNPHYVVLCQSSRGIGSSRGRKSAGFPISRTASTSSLSGCRISTTLRSGSSNAA